MGILDRFRSSGSADTGFTRALRYGDVEGMLDAGRSHKGRKSAEKGPHSALLTEIEIRLRAAVSAEHSPGPDCYLNPMHAQMAVDYHALLTNGEPEPMPAAAAELVA